MAEQDDVAFWSASRIAAAVADKLVKPSEIVSIFLDRIASINPKLDAYTTVLGDLALDTAMKADAAVARGVPLGPLHGVPIAIKDLEDHKAGVPSSYGSRLLVDYVPSRSATYVERMEAAGAIVLGKTNAPEFGHKGTTDNEVWGPTSSPFGLGLNAGGSSGGSAAAVAAGLASAAQGSDGGGSIRIPAALCGVLGFKGSFGRVAAAVTPNAFGFHSPFVHFGPLTRSAEDAALLLSVMSGPHPRDPFSLPSDGTAWFDELHGSIRALRIGFSFDLGTFPVEHEVREALEGVLTRLQDSGISIVEVPPLPYDHGVLSAVWLRQMGAMYLGGMAAFAREGRDLLANSAQMTAQFRQVIESALEVERTDPSYLRRDNFVRTDVLNWSANVFEQCDLLITPTLGVVSVRNGPRGTTTGPSSIEGVTVDPSIGWCLTHPFNFTGNPAASVPVAWTDQGLPVGLQVVGPRLSDGLVLRACAELERLFPWAHRYPPEPISDLLLDRTEPTT